MGLIRSRVADNPPSRLISAIEAAIIAEMAAVEGAKATGTMFEDHLGKRN
jgi:hypothetical protein